MLESIEKLLVNLGQLFTTPLLYIGDTNISLSLLFQLSIYLIIALLLGRIFKNLLTKVLLVKLGIDKANREAISTIFSYGISSLGILVILQTQGFNVSSLAVLAGGLGVGIGLGFQNITKNFISGLNVLIERPIKIGDFIQLENDLGFVEEIGLRSTRIRTLQDSHVIIPNGMLIEGKIHNLTYDNFQGRIEVDVFVSDDSDPVLVTEAILMAAYMEPAVLREPHPKVLFLGFEDNAFRFQLWAWVNEIYNEPLYMSSLRFSIQHNLDKQGVLVPWDHFNIYFHHPPHSKNSESSPNTILHGLKNYESISDKPLSARDLLKQVTYFENFTNLELRKLIEVGYRKRLKRLDFLFHEGEPGDTFYIILSGSVEVFVEKINKHLITLKAGKFFGELSLMLGIPRTASVRAIEDTILFAIHKKGFEKMLHENPELAEVIVQEFGKHQEELLERQNELREMGLVDAQEYDKNILVWVRNRLKNLFNLN
ncbi:mechanosensitive ion channel domain-containing protein [Okeania sp.]|uniref:mechanosensitive ion channel domain-containing protein n=1 Tax=Okeania sp. TaxID=3100323 RepID=UPI002B4B568F|nr:mechanosensitive ion channel domain-containing protein [Okeania sp.]MEB3342893.1 mechanosensitive ion channel domain-containing protein [Okeania sp.]